jgi:hypothetical protein
MHSKEIGISFDNGTPRKLISSKLKGLTKKAKYEVNKIQKELEDDNTTGVKEKISLIRFLESKVKRN